MGSDESHFNVSLIVRVEVTRPCPQTTTFEEKGEPKRHRTEVLPLTAKPNRLTFTSAEIIGLIIIGTGSPGRPLRLYHSSRALLRSVPLFPIPNEHSGFCGREAP